ncbi:peptidoglycan D,D-transpeptidase FtsI family protein [Kiritimatiella glycovorans]|uniref:Peptidoglycan synthase FtsI n=1 Tax=Kiritimatiella glycovorans TaxID=1307763 RepID=A0A0G3EEV5_9BACT|nr:penicillin-binding protein 2 [Kiritimatiella glycovorans]AKJ65001.1 Peptidoglycan synthase FtsI precursor [Kiritimatiella glycovorans]
MKNRRGKTRVVLCTIFFAAAFTGLGFRLYLLHFHLEAPYQQTIRGSQQINEEVAARRGRILDRRGNLFALDLARKHVCADPAYILGHGAVDSVATRLAGVLGTDAAEIAEKLDRPKRRYVRLRKYVSSETAESVTALELPGVFLEEAYRRHYPKGPLMAHVVGFANTLNDGCAGVELAMDRYLKGTPGRRVGERDGSGREIYSRRVLEQPPESGADVYLTLDQQIQYIAERAVQKAFTRHRAAGAWAVVQRVRTGEILAMASAPSYDPNRYGDARPEWRRNRAVEFVYEPGSTMKAVTVASALDAGAVRTDEIIDCEAGRWYYGGRSLSEYHGHAYGPLTVADVLKKSSNIGAAKIALRLGEEPLERYFRSFGFGEKPGTELPAEEGGLFAPAERWSKISITRLAMGHEIGVTALQMLNAVCTIANDGRRLRPSVIKRVTRGGEDVVLENRREPLDRAVSPRVAHQMRAMMARVTGEGGTAPQAAIEGFEVAGKTGTAQKIGPDGRYLRSRTVASFVGFVPADRPEIGIIVVVDDPEDGGTGGRVAAPAFAEIGEETLRFLGIPADGTEEFYTAEGF